ncbi:MAG: hypothetical protein AB8F34_04610 [Akkermansiaceae bacterium]
MKYILLPTLAIASCFTLMLTSCGEKKADETGTQTDYSGMTHENIGEYAEKIVKDVPPMLMEIKDEKSFDEALAKLDGVAERVNALTQAAAALPAPKKSELEGLHQKLDDYMDEVVDGGGSDMDTAQKHVSDLVGEKPELREKFKELRNKFRSVFGPIKNIFDEDGAVGSKAE